MKKSRIEYHAKRVIKKSRITRMRPVLEGVDYKEGVATVTDGQRAFRINVEDFKDTIIESPVDNSKVEGMYPEMDRLFDIDCIERITVSVDKAKTIRNAIRDDIKNGTRHIRLECDAQNHIQVSGMDNEMKSIPLFTDEGFGEAVFTTHFNIRYMKEALDLMIETTQQSFDIVSTHHPMKPMKLENDTTQYLVLPVRFR